MNYFDEIISCPECGKEFARRDWPTFPSNGKPRRTCCLTTGDNNKRKYLERQKVVDGQVLFHCNKCNEHKSQDDFHKSKGRVKSICKSCHKSNFDPPKAKKWKPKKFAWMEIIRRIKDIGWSFCYECQEFKVTDEDFYVNKNGSTNGVCNQCRPHRIRKHKKDRHSRQKAIEKTCDSTLNAKSLIKLFSAFTHCPVCGENMNRNDKTLDHIVPLSKGGMHSIHNSIIVCRSCNSSKGAKDFENWLSQLSWGKFITYYETVLGIPELSDVSERIEQWLRQEALKLAQATMKQEPERSTLKQR